MTVSPGRSGAGHSIKIARIIWALMVTGESYRAPKVIGAVVKGGEKPDQRAEQNTATAAVGVRWSEEVGIRLVAAGAGNAGRA